MNPMHFDYSLKSIPIPSQAQYKKVIIGKAEDFIQRMRWKMLYIKHKDLNKEKKTYGFKTSNTPPAFKELKAFEDDIFTMIRDIRFRRINNIFQNKLTKDVREIKNSSQVIISADKSSNRYEMPVESYKKLLQENITKNYKKASKEDIIQTNKKASRIANNLGIADRVDKFIESEAYITLKDHKQAFPKRIECRLLNPAKSNIGKISCQTLKTAIKQIKKGTMLNQWSSSDDVTKWFENININTKSTFFKFDIEQFYPSITSTLMHEAIQWAKHYYSFTEMEIQTITNARESYLFNNSIPWVKKIDSKFDVSMGAYDGAEISEIVGLFLLNQVSDIFGKQNVGLYRDDGLGILNLSGP